ncbi:MAG: hypothetical protein NZM37_06610 [Sandaracinaceae bacterium]|nr:hypothetical protein [Sandaracinaceae bacterium]
MPSLLRSAMCALYPRTEALPGIEDTDLDGFLRELRSEAPLLLRFGLFVAALVFHLTPLFTIGRPFPAFLLPKEQLDRHAARLGECQWYWIKQAIFLLKLACGLCWGRNPVVRERMGLAPYGPDSNGWRQK